jgi:hypothetical protein
MGLLYLSPVCVIPSSRLRISGIINMLPYVLMAATGTVEMLRKIKKIESGKSVGGWKGR